MAKEAWSALVEAPLANGPGLQDEVLPWEGSIRDIVANFHGSTPLGRELGDVFYNQPGRLNYVARKLELAPDIVTGCLRSNPSTFIHKGMQYSLHKRGLDLVWGLWKSW